MATLKEDMAHFTTLASIRVPRVMRVVFFMVLAAIVIAVAFLIYVPWVQTTSGRGVVTVRFETAETGPGPVRSYAVDDPALSVPPRPTDD